MITDHGLEFLQQKVEVVVTGGKGLLTFTGPFPTATLLETDTIDLVMGSMVLFGEAAKSRVNTAMRRRPSGRVHLIKRHSRDQQGRQWVTPACWDNSKGYAGEPLTGYTDRFSPKAPRCRVCERDANS